MKNKVLLVLISVLFLLIFISGCASMKRNTNADVLLVLNDRVTEMVVVYEDNQFEDELMDPVEIIAIFIWNPDTEQFVLERGISK